MMTEPFMPPTTQQSQDQARNSSAWTNIDTIKSSSMNKEYRALVRGLPADIQTMGLAQTLAFLQAKGEEQHRKLGSHLNDWLKGSVTGGVDATDWLRLPATTSTESMRATREALSYIVWLKRYAEALIPAGDEGEDG
jgi:CRISPR-associated protein Cmr5